MMLKTSAYRMNGMVRRILKNSIWLLPREESGSEPDFVISAPAMKSGSTPFFWLFADVADGELGDAAAVTDTGSPWRATP